MQYKIICRTDKLNKNGEAPLYLQFYHDGRRKKIALGIAVNPQFWDSSSQQISPEHPNQPSLQHQLNEILIGYDRKIRRLEALEIPITMNALVESHQRSPSFKVGAYILTIIERLEQEYRLGSASKYHITYSLLKQAGKIDCRFDDIDFRFLSEFETFLIQRGNKPNSIATKFSVLKAIYNKAIADKIFVCKENPFVIYKSGKHWEQTRKRAIRKEDVMRLMQAPLPETRSPYTELSRDIFLFSYFSAGINFKDISTLRYSNIANGRIYYRRHKTGKEMNCRLTPTTEAIIDKYKRAGNTEDDYIFPILDGDIHKSEQQIYNRLHKVLAHINRELKGWSKRLSISPPLTTYVARHTYATVLKREGVNVALISESLGHSNIQTTQIYLDSFENSQIDEAMKHLL
jgi:site-specific recombinase XerD